MIVSSILAAARGLGVTLSARDGRLAVRAPEGVLTAELRTAFVAHKAELLLLLDAEGHATDPPTTPPKTSETGRGGDERTPLYTWEELSTWRWGPAVGDPTPGLVVDHPDAERRRAALAAADPDDPEAIEERLSIQQEEPLSPQELAEHLHRLGLQDLTAGPPSGPSAATARSATFPPTEADDGPPVTDDRLPVVNVDDPDGLPVVNADDPDGLPVADVDDPDGLPVADVAGAVIEPRSAVSAAAAEVQAYAVGDRVMTPDGPGLVVRTYANATAGVELTGQRKTKNYPLHDLKKETGR